MTSRAQGWLIALAASIIGWWLVLWIAGFVASELAKIIAPVFGGGAL